MDALSKLTEKLISLNLPSGAASEILTLCGEYASERFQQGFSIGAGTNDKAGIPHEAQVTGQYRVTNTYGFPDPKSPKAA